MPHTSTTAEPTRSSSQATSPSLLQRLGNIDLFNDLLFHREKVYQSIKRFSPVRTSASVKEENPTQFHKVEEENSRPAIWHREPKTEERDPSEDISVLSYLQNTDMAVGRPKGRQPRKAPAKAKPKGKPSLVTTRKRSGPAASKTERASKVRKTVPKANSGRRVNGRGASITDAFVISDDDDGDDVAQLRRDRRTDSLTPPDQKLKVDSPGSEDDLNPIRINDSNDSNNSNSNNSNSNNSIDLEKELLHEKAKHARELAQLHQQLDASTAATKQAQEAASSDITKLHLDHSITSSKQSADTNEMLEAERSRSSALAWECEYVRRELEAVSTRVVGEAKLIRERDAYERRCADEREVAAGLRLEVVGMEAEAAGKATAAAEERRQLVVRMEVLQQEVTRLKSEGAVLGGEYAALKAKVEVAEVASMSVSTSSEQRTDIDPRCSQSSTAFSAEQRLANMRKTYVTVKRRYDSLHAVASNLSTSTRSLDYGNFGEFGYYLRQLRGVLDESGQEGRVSGFVAKVE
ncbi:hypothetical protein EKO04_000579 [Ascochyta lentis]|uniref:Uncharacterized protein n=1 Tax=Ascochyta lentis TaxID=205686 RepID=A0A8H7JD85_9PLEO|nr:hypothetical protein EKO04_000579 [Ascochyta lentis]